MKAKRTTTLPPAVPVSVTLEERGETYGSYACNARIAQQLKAVLTSGQNFSGLSMVERESLDMICSKMARVVNGKHHIDNWRDIASYAELVMSPDS